MRIAHFLADAPNLETANGVRRGVHCLARAEVDQGCEVAIYCFSKQPVTIPNVRVKTFAPPLLPFRIPGALTRELANWAPDMLSLHQPYQPSNASLAAWARRSGLPYCVTPHGGLSPGELRERLLLKLPYKHLFERRILNGARFVRATGECEDLAAYGVAAPVLVIPNGFEFESMPPKLDPGALRRRVPELGKRRVFAYLGRLDPAQKGLDLLLEAIAQSRSADAAYVFCGPDWRGGRRRLLGQIAAAELSSTVFVIDAVYGAERFDLLAGADVFVHPSRWEGMPNVVLEAAAVGIPMLVTRPADPLGRLGSRGAALRVDCTVDSIADALQRLARLSAEELREMGARGRSIVTADFSWSRTAERLIEAYRTCRTYRTY